MTARFQLAQETSFFTRRSISAKTHPMQTLTRRTLLALTTALLTGCAASGDGFSPLAPADGKGVIYVYRPLGKVLGRGEDPYVQLGTGLPRRLRAGGYIAFEVPEGMHTVRAFQNMLFLPTIPFFVTVEVPAGRASYLRLDQQVTKLGSSQGGVRAMQQVTVEEVDTTTGAAEIAATRAN